MAATRIVSSKRTNVAVVGLSGKGNSLATTCAQRIEAFTSRESKQVTLSEIQVLDAEGLFRDQDTDDTGLLCRGALTETLRRVGLEERLGDQAFRSTARLAFDAHSADSHFLSMTEFKQLYYLMTSWYPELLPRQPILKICVLRGKGLPAMDLNGKSDPFVTVQVAGKPRSKVNTRHVEKSLDPVWNEELDDRFCYEEGDDLEFGVFDFDKGSRIEPMGRARLAGGDFHKEGGFEGDLKLTDLPKDFKGGAPTLRVRVAVTELEPRPERPQQQRGSAWEAPRVAMAPSKGKVDMRAVAHLALAGGLAEAAPAPAATPDPGHTPAAGAAPPAAGAPE